jgi:glycosyltransferase involved in cell wall biosynthesis
MFTEERSNLPEPVELRVRFDAAVMLTWSDWKSEPRSNRFHYASRFGRHLPVLFVQPDHVGPGYWFEPSDTENVTILHVPQGPAFAADRHEQVRLLSSALCERKIVKPLLWIYNFYLRHFARSCCAALKVYHATEDYFGDAMVNWDRKFMEHLRELLQQCDMIVAVSGGVADKYRDVGGFTGRIEVATNGCDSTFFAGESGSVLPRPGRPIACYQGGINYRLDFCLLDAIVAQLPDWDFVFLGRVWFGDEHARARRRWEQLTARKNVRYLGELKPEGLRRELHAATVGLIPFGRSESIRERSFPLKAFEYVACGLPVVSVPIRELRPWPELFHFADTAEVFAVAVRTARTLRCDPAMLARRAEAARAQSYDARFAEVSRTIVQTPRASRQSTTPVNLLVLFGPHSVHVKTIAHHLRSFSLFSGNKVAYAPALPHGPCPYDLSHFDAIVIHYSVRVCFAGCLSPSWTEALRGYPGLKVLFVQDEYDHTERTRRAIEETGVQIVYTCVPPESVPLVYPPERFAHVRFLPTLTGYVPLDLARVRAPKPLSERRLTIGYRGREIGWWYGHLGWDKAEIGRRMKAICDAEGVACDIAWDNDSRIYGDGWFDFLNDCRATLGTESGSNVFDFHGNLRRQVEEELRLNPTATYEEIHAKYLQEHEGRIVQNQVSPKVFEAVACRTALVLFEGRYSGVLTPGVHYLPLRKDYSNAREILARLQDDAFVEAMTGQAYQDVVASGRYSYATFVREFDEELRKRIGYGVIPGLCPVSSPLSWAAGASLPGPPREARIDKGMRRRSTPSLTEKLMKHPAGRLVVKASQGVGTLRHLLRPVSVGVQRILGPVSLLGWYLRTFLGNRTIRRTLWRGMRAGKSVALARDLIKVAILRRLRTGVDPDAMPCFIVPHFGTKIVGFISLPADDTPLLPDSVDVKEWAAVAEALAAGQITDIRWDHSRIEEPLRYKASWFTYFGDLYLAPRFVHHFVGLLDLARHDPATAVALLRYAAGEDLSSNPLPPFQIPDDPAAIMTSETEALTTVS